MDWGCGSSNRAPALLNIIKIKSSRFLKQVWWYMPIIPVIPALGRLRQKDHKFETSPCYIPRPCLKKKKKIQNLEHIRFWILDIQITD
jgi:hypothetical protein